VAGELGRPLASFTPEAVARLERHPWIGNVRELDNAIARAALLARGERVDAADLTFPEVSPTGEVPGGEVEDLRLARAAFERFHVLRVLARYGDDKARAAQALGIDVSSLYRKLSRDGGEADRGAEDARGGDPPPAR
jgi:two-component system NtrC family response regulator